MKRAFLPLTASLAFVGAAFADPVTVMVPKDLSTRESVELYKAKLDSAVEKVCRRASGPVIGLAYYTFQACLDQTRADVAKADPTGLYRKKAETTLTLAAK